MISQVFKTLTRFSAAKVFPLLCSCAPKALPLASTRCFSDVKKDNWFESVRYTVDTTGLKFMHVLKESSQWDEIVIKNKKPVVVCFYATWCTPCTVLVPTLEEKIVSKKGSLEYAKVNIDEQRLLAVKNQVKTVPSILVFKEGKQVAKKAGMPTDLELDKLLAKAESAEI